MRPSPARQKIAHCHRAPIAYTGRMKYALLSLCLALPIVAADKQAKPRFELKLGGSLSKIAPAAAFTIKLHGEETETLLVLSSSGDYTISREHSGPNFEHLLQFDGSAASADGKKNQFTYAVVTMHEDRNEGERGAFTVKGSAVLKAGKETTLGQLGGQTLTVTATVDE